MDVAGNGDVADWPDEEAGVSAGETLERLLREALRCGASHLHLDPGLQEMTVRFRIDGFLSTEATLPKALERALVSRIKVVAGVDLTERRMPQTGFFALSEKPNPRIRVEVAPVLHGERVTLAIEPGAAAALHLDALGLPEASRKALQWMAERDRGLILAAGPTDSGRKTLLSALLIEALTDARHAASIECPVERPLAGVSQMEVNPAAGCDQHRLLSSVKRQDVDLLLCCPLEDGEAARQVIDLAAEGCLVLAGMHAPGAIRSLTRLVESGVEPFLIATTLPGVVGQRLVRCICADCRDSYEPAGWELAALGLERAALREGRLWRGRGCPACRRTGYRGRTGLHEVLVMSGELQDAICRGAGMAEMERLAGKAGFENLRQDGAAKVLAGITTVEEVVRVVG